MALLQAAKRCISLAETGIIEIISCQFTLNSGLKEGKTRLSINKVFV